MIKRGLYNSSIRWLICLGVVMGMKGGGGGGVSWRGRLREDG